MAGAASHPAPIRPLLRSVTIAVMAFLTVVDLFATQAILPTLAGRYGVTPAQMGLAVNATTAGMAIASLLAALFGAKLARRDGIVASLLLLAVPTALLALAPDLTAFTVLRVAQGLCMAAAFTWTLAYLGEQCSAADRAGAFAAYVAGNVASNLVGRLLSAAVADHAGVAANFLVFALLNLAGAALAAATLSRMPAPGQAPAMPSAVRGLLEVARNRRLLPVFAIGFCILFAFIGTFSFVNFVLVRAPVALSPMQLGLIYLVFLPSLATTLPAGAVAVRLGARNALWAGFGLAATGLVLLLVPQLATLLAGLMLVGIGTFFAQAVATGEVARRAGGRGALASGTYLAAYFSGGLAGAAVLGMLFDRYGWPACVAGIFVALLAAAALATRLGPETEWP
jgi:predicted MFS family arabinose efflux permease